MKRKGLKISAATWSVRRKLSSGSCWTGGHEPKCKGQKRPEISQLLEFVLPRFFSQTLTLADVDHACELAEMDPTMVNTVDMLDFPHHNNTLAHLLVFYLISYRRSHTVVVYQNLLRRLVENHRLDIFKANYFGHTAVGFTVLLSTTSTCSGQSIHLNQLKQAQQTLGILRAAYHRVIQREVDRLWDDILPGAVIRMTRYTRFCGIVLYPDMARHLYLYFLRARLCRCEGGKGEADHPGVRAKLVAINFCIYGHNGIRGQVVPHELVDCLFQAHVDNIVK